MKYLFPRLTTNCVVVHSQDAFFAKVETGAVAVKLTTDRCFGLNAIATRICELAASPTQVQQICDRLVDEFNVDRDICERDTLDLLEELRAEAIVIVLGEK